MRIIGKVKWRPVTIQGYEDVYEVSSQGNVRRSKPASRTFVGRILKASATTKGYLQVDLRDGARRTVLVHVLVAEAFLSPRPTLKHQINHCDGNKANNVVENLEWVTGSENVQHAHRLGLVKPARGERVTHAKLTASSVRDIRRQYARGGSTQRTLARLFGVTQKAIWQIVKDKTWRHVHE